MAKYAAFGTLLKTGDGASPEAFTTIANVMGVSDAGSEVEMLDATDHSSQDGWKEKLAGLIDGGVIAAQIHYDPAGPTHDDATGLIKDMTDRTLRTFQVVWPDDANTTYQFTAFVKSFKAEGQVDGKLVAAIELEISGVVDFSA